MKNLHKIQRNFTNLELAGIWYFVSVRLNNNRVEFYHYKSQIWEDLIDNTGAVSQNMILKNWAKKGYPYEVHKLTLGIV